MMRGHFRSVDQYFCNKLPLTWTCPRLLSSFVFISLAFSSSLASLVFISLVLQFSLPSFHLTFAGTCLTSNRTDKSNNFWEGPFFRKVSYKGELRCVQHGFFGLQKTVAKCVINRTTLFHAFYQELNKDQQCNTKHAMHSRTGEWWRKGF